MSTAGSAPVVMDSEDQGSSDEEDIQEVRYKHKFTFSCGIISIFLILLPLILSLTSHSPSFQAYNDCANAPFVARFWKFLMLGESHDHFWSRDPWALAGFDVHGNQKESVGMYSSSAIRMRYFLIFFFFDF